MKKKKKTSELSGKGSILDHATVKRCVGFQLKLLSARASRMDAWIVSKVLRMQFHSKKQNATSDLWRNHQSKSVKAKNVSEKLFGGKQKRQLSHLTPNLTYAY